MIKSKVKLWIPPLVPFLRMAWYKFNLIKARSAYLQAKADPEFLSYTQLEELDKIYRVQEGHSYDAASLNLRAQERFTELSAIFEKHHIRKPESVLEIGCGDGMIGYYFAKEGSKCFAIDNDESLFDKRAAGIGVKFSNMDAATLEYDDDTFDFIFNYNIYEHLNDPQKAFSESLRVLKPGGYLYIKFTPTYYSPLGFHAYKSIAVPYCHLLFSFDTLKKFTLQNQRNIIDYSLEALNKVSINEFRSIWHSKDYNKSFLEYNEIQNFAFLDLIAKFPEKFKSAGVDFENFTTEGFELLIKKSN